MRQINSKAIRAALLLGVPKHMSPENRATYRFAKKKFNDVPRQERAGYLNGLYRNSLRLQDLKQKIAEEKALQAAEDAAEVKS